MITNRLYTYDIGKYYTILPTIQKWSVDEYIDYFS